MSRLRFLLLLCWICPVNFAFEAKKSIDVTKQALLSVQSLGQMAQVRLLDPEKEPVIFRFYCITRLNKIMHIILFLLNSVPHASDLSQCFFGDASLYADKNIIELWDDLNAYKHMDTNEAHIRHFILSVLFFLYSQKNTHGHLQSFLEYEPHHTIVSNFERLNIDELLQAIDIIVDNINHLHHHYQESGLSFKLWLQTYWWIPTLVITSFLLKILKYYYHEEITQN